MENLFFLFINASFLDISSLGELINILINYVQTNPLFSVLVTIISISGAIGTWIWRFRPKVIQTERITNYIDDSVRRAIEEWEITFDWGKIPKFKQIKLMEIQPGSESTLTIIPPDGIEILVNSKYFEKKPQKHYQEIKIKNKKYFDNENVKKIKILIEKPISQKYREKIKKEILAGFIEITNENSSEIKNYLFSIPNHLRLERLDNAYQEIDSVVFNFSISSLGSILNQKLSLIHSSSQNARLLISKIPPKEGLQPSKLRIKLS